MIHYSAGSITKAVLYVFPLLSPPPAVILLGTAGPVRHQDSLSTWDTLNSTEKRKPSPLTEIPHLVFHGQCMHLGA